DEQMAGHPGPARQEQQPAGSDREGDANQCLPAEIGEGGNPEVAQNKQCQAGSKQGQTPPQQQGQAGEAEKMDFQPFMQAGAQGPERDQYDGAAKAEVLIEGLIKQGTQQGATQAE